MATAFHGIGFHAAVFDLEIAASGNEHFPHGLHFITIKITEGRI
jgi:hypothetical protein